MKGVLKMQMTRITFEDFMDFSMEEAVEHFRKTEEYDLLREDAERAESDLKAKFGESGYQFIEKCLDTILQPESREGTFLYQQGYRDCIALLKKLEVLA